MSKKKITEKEIIDLLEEKELERPSMEFIDRLVHAVGKIKVDKPVTESWLERYLGNTIIGILLSICLWYLYELDVFGADPNAFVSGAAFVVGTWASIWMIGNALERTSKI